MPTSTTRSSSRSLGLGVGALALLALSGCASLRDLRSDVSTYSQWPAERKPSTYVFDRLPSQQANLEQQQKLEDAARPGLDAAGFKAAPEGAPADFSVQLGARVEVNQRSLYDDPFWWHGGLYRSRFGYGGFGGFGLYGGYGGRGGFGAWGWNTPSYEREVAVLIRDRKTGTPLYESRASNDGSSPSINALLGAMYEAAMKDFPASDPKPRTVVTRIAP